MRAVVTRVKHASVTIEGRVNGQIGEGYLVLLGVGPNDTEETAVKLADKICNLRVFEDEDEKMNLDLEGEPAGRFPVHPVRRHLLPPPGLLRRGEAGSGHPPLREVHGPLPGAGLHRGARRVRGGYAGLLPERRPGDDYI